MRTNFRTKDAELWRGDRNQWRRIEHYERFIPSHQLVGRYVLDVGDRNLVGHYLSPNAHNTREDLNYHVVPDIPPPLVFYDTILCFEVLEHVQNPLNLLECLNSALAEGGVLYLSTPVANPVGNLFQSANHFTEYKLSVMPELFKLAGFRIVRREVFRHYPLPPGIGLRPLSRWIWGKIQLYELRRTV